jgi:hypothetical protein
MSDRCRKNVPVLSERRVPRDDRRGAPRYFSNGTPALIGWDEGNEKRTTVVSLIDISMGGLSAWVEVFPPHGRTVWFRLDGECPTPWLKASVVSSTTSGCLFWTRRRVRLRFLEACTYDLFKRAIDGFTREQQFQDKPFEGFDSRYWR